MSPKRTCPERTSKPLLLEPGRDRERRLREAAARMMRVKQLAVSFSSARRGPKQRAHMAALTSIEPASVPEGAATIVPAPNSGDSEDWVSLFSSGGVGPECRMEGDRPPTPTFEPSPPKRRASRRPRPPVTQELLPPPTPLSPIPELAPEIRSLPVTEPSSPELFSVAQFRTGARGLVPWEHLIKKELGDAISQIPASGRPPGMLARIRSYRPPNLPEGERYRLRFKTSTGKRVYVSC